MQEKVADAALVQTQFELAWKNADVPLQLSDL